MQSTFFAVIEIVGLHRGLWKARVPAPILQLGSHDWPFCVRTPSTLAATISAHSGIAAASARSVAQFALGPTAPAWRCLLEIKGVGSIRPINAALARTSPTPELIPREVILPGHRSARPPPAEQPARTSDRHRASWIILARARRCRLASNQTTSPISVGGSANTPHIWSSSMRDRILTRPFGYAGNRHRR